MYYLPNFNNDCDNSIEWADNIENIVESEMLKISVNLSKYKPKEKENKIDIMQSQLDKEKSKLKRLYELYADGNDTVLDMIKDQESIVKNLDDSIKEEQKSGDNNPKKQFVYENIKKLADVWDDIDKPAKNKILKTIIDKIIIVNGNVEIQLKNF